MLELRDESEASRGISSGEAPVIGRIHARGAQYTHVKMLLKEWSQPLQIMWWNHFGSKTYRAIDKEIRKREQSRAIEDEREKNLTLALRWYYLLNLYRDLHSLLRSRHGSRRSLEWSYSQKGTRLVVHETAGTRTKILVERHIADEELTFGEQTVAWMNQETVSRAVSDLLSTYFPMSEILSRRPGRWLRTKRERPKGWPLTVRGIEMLYDYLFPFYKARPYKLRDRLSAGNYPAQLIRDLTEVARLELETAWDLSEADVRGAIQRYLVRLRKQGGLERALGTDMFLLGPWQQVRTGRTRTQEGTRGKLRETL